jgi:hypothetical protein
MITGISLGNCHETVYIRLSRLLYGDMYGCRVPPLPILPRHIDRRHPQASDALSQYVRALLPPARRRDQAAR